MTRFWQQHWLCHRVTKRQLSWRWICLVYHCFHDKLFKSLKDQFDLDPSQVMVNFSHTHDGPQVESRSYAVDSEGNPIDPIDKYVENTHPGIRQGSWGSV